MTDPDHKDIIRTLEERMHSNDVDHAVIGVALENQSEDIKEIKAGLTSIQKTLIGLAVSLILSGSAAILVFLLNNT